MRQLRYEPVEIINRMAARHLKFQAQVEGWGSVHGKIKVGIQR
jgi:hypothetical protein